MHDIILQIERQWLDLLKVRSMFPTMKDNLIGANKFSTAPYYQTKGLDVEFRMKDPLTAYSIAEINQIGRWINESFVIRLHAFLEYHEIIPQNGKGRIDTSLDGHEELDILRRLRRFLVHRSGDYNPENPDSRKLYVRMVDHFSLRTESAETATKYPVQIDGFLQPSKDGCIRYINGYLERNHSQS